MQRDPKGTHIKPKEARPHPKSSWLTERQNNISRSTMLQHLKGSCHPKKQKYMLFFFHFTHPPQSNNFLLQWLWRTQDLSYRRGSVWLCLLDKWIQVAQSSLTDPLFKKKNCVVTTFLFVTDSQSEERRLKLKGMGAKTACFREKMNTGVAPMPGIE